MTGDKTKIMSLKKQKEISITFGNNNLAIIVGKCTVSFGNKDALAENVLLIENMKYNLLSVS